MLKKIVKTSQLIYSDEPITDRTKVVHDRERENHDQIISTVIRVVASRLKEFNDLLQNPPTVCTNAC